jgi:hypothetical protein
LIWFGRWGTAIAFACHPAGFVNYPQERGP